LPPARPLDPFGGPLKRVLGELERRIEEQQMPKPPPIPTRQMREWSEAARLEREQQEAAELRALEEARDLAVRRAAEHARQLEQAARAESALLAASRARLVQDLRDPQGLRRAFLLREVLGTPVGMR
jgi:hypothetical protein